MTKLNPLNLNKGNMVAAGDQTKPNQEKNMNNKAKQLLEVEGGAQAKSPALAWEHGNLRIVVVYNTSGSDPVVHLEKLIGKDCLGDECWIKVELPKEVPAIIIRELALHASGDSNILKN